MKVSVSEKIIGGITDPVHTETVAAALQRTADAERTQQLEICDAQSLDSSQ
jgi:hypothetical protein